MEGDNTERRQRAKEARDQGEQASENQVTLGASKQREHEPRSADQDTKLSSRDQGKRSSR